MGKNWAQGSSHYLSVSFSSHDRVLLQGQTFMVIGAAGELPKPPAEPIKFLEDMNDTELADAVGPISLIHLHVLIRFNQLGMPVGLTKCASEHPSIARHLTLYTQLGKYLLYERDHSSPACYSRAADRSLRVRHAIPSGNAIPDTRHLQFT
jgi:hypothetical protein